MKTLSIVTACFNEEGNVELLHERVRAVMAALPEYRWEHIFIDNSSSDRTVPILKRLAAQFGEIRVIVNARNFGHIRSPSHALFQAGGDAVISLVADFQDPPEMIPQMVRAWEAGAAAVLCIKRSSMEAGLLFWMRRQYYRLTERLSSIPTYQNFTGFGLFDRRVMDIARSFADPYPFFRGLIAEIGLPVTRIEYDQPRRRFGITKNNWYTLYDIGILGIINHSRVPLRLGRLRRLCRRSSYLFSIHGLPGPEAGVLVDLQLRPGAAVDRRLFCSFPAVGLFGHLRRICRSDLHPGARPSLCN